jgi:GT2 family glycosyltransferase
MKLSFLVVNYNGGAYIDACLASISKHAASFEHEVIVVDNNSTDGSNVAIAQSYPAVKVILNARNVGFSRAMNQAFRASTGEYIFSFNPDAELTEGCMERLIAFMEANPRVGKVGTATLEDGRILMPATDFPRWNSFQIWKAIRSKLPATTPQAMVHEGSVEWLFGTGILVRRSAIGSSDSLYPEKSFLFWEEYWLSRQIRKNGFEIVVLPDAQIIHHAGVTFKKNIRKLIVARNLALSHEFLIRQSHYGTFNARLNTMLHFLDHFALCLILLPKRILHRRNVDLNNTISDYYAKARGAWFVLFKPRAAIESFNQQAEEFFNR